MLRRLIAAFGVLMLTFCLLPDAAALSAVTENGVMTLTLTPQIADGATLTGSPSLIVKGIDNGDNTFTFTETRQVSVSVLVKEGWQVSTAHSVFLPSFTVTSENGVTTLSATVREGQTVENTLLRSLAINTTPDELPRLYLSVEGDFSAVTKKEWVDCSVRLVLGTKRYRSGSYSGSGKVKGRGNSSWTRPEKPYSINLDKSASLLDIPANKKYCILTNSYDTSMVRNLSVLSAANELDALGYVVHAEPCEVYLNGSYNGVYVLAERVRLSETKIAEEQASETNVTGAYLLEKTVGSKLVGSSDVGFKAPYYANPGSRYDFFSFKDPDTVTDEMAAYVKNAVFAAHDAIVSESETAYRDHLDTASAIDEMILQEIVKNIDGGMKTSVYLLLKPNSTKLRFTSPWDFDLALGQYSGTNNGDETNADGLHAVVTDSTSSRLSEGFIAICQSAPWFEALYKKPSFRAALEERYTLLRYTFVETLQQKIEYYAAYQENALTDHEDYRTKKSVSDNLNFLKSWLTKRLTWLDGEWLDETKIPSVLGRGMIAGDVTRDGFVGAADEARPLRRRH